jgi:hypothetical protein
VTGSTGINSQIRSASDDVVEVLEVYKQLSAMPDFSERLETDPAAAQENVVVDIVPPHCNRRPTSAARGYCVADLATRAAIGRILPDRTADYSAEFTPQKIKVGESTRAVEIT